MSTYPILRAYEAYEGKRSWETLAEVLALAKSMGGMVANLVQIIEHPECLYDGKWPYSPLSEEIVGLDTYGKYTTKGDLIFVTVHGLGVLTPDTLKKAEQVGYVGNGSANLDKIFPEQDILSTILNENLMPDGRSIEIIPYSDYQETGVSDSSLLHGIVRTRQQATYPDFNKISALADNPQVITYCGGKERTANLFEAWAQKGQGGFHTRNILFDPSKIFKDAQQRRLVATMATPLMGPCDGFYGSWPLSNLDHFPLRYLLFGQWEATEYSTFEEFKRALYRFLPPGVDPKLDFTPINFCAGYGALESEVSFYENILDYDVVKHDNDKYLLWNGEEYAIFTAVNLQVKVSGANSEHEREDTPTIMHSHRTNNLDDFYEKCRKHGIKIEEDNRGSDRSMIICAPSGAHYEVTEQGINDE